MDGALQMDALSLMKFGNGLQRLSERRWRCGSIFLDVIGNIARTIFVAFQVSDLVQARSVLRVRDNAATTNDFQEGLGLGSTERVRGDYGVLSGVTDLDVIYVQRAETKVEGGSCSRAIRHWSPIDVPFHLHVGVAAWLHLSLQTQSLAFVEIRQTRKLLDKLRFVLGEVIIGPFFREVLVFQISNLLQTFGMLGFQQKTGLAY